MHDPTLPPEVQFYQIEIGHHRLRMPGATREEAIARARQHLAQEMPRLWDVIHKLDASRFQVFDVNQQHPSQ